MQKFTKSSIHTLKFLNGLNRHIAYRKQVAIKATKMEAFVTEEKLFTEPKVVEVEEVSPPRVDCLGELRAILAAIATHKTTDEWVDDFARLFPREKVVALRSYLVDESEIMRRAAGIIQGYLTENGDEAISGAAYPAFVTLCVELRCLMQSDRNTQGLNYFIKRLKYVDEGDASEWREPPGYSTPVLEEG